MHRKKSSFALAVAALLMLAACTGRSPEEQQKIDKMQTEPEITLVGTFDGCEVKYVNRYYRDSSFFLAKCAMPSAEGTSNTTSTTTRHITDRVGKTDVARTRTEITQEIAKLQEEAKAAELRETAIGKLSTGERQALGIAAK